MSCDGGGIKAVLGLIGIFKKYASKDQDTDHLNKSELKELLQKEFPGLIADNPKPEDVNKIMAALDHDKDGQVDIQEYFVTLCALGIGMSKGGAGCQKKK
ncbi:protein S100-G-like [Anabas testudineus]|uniref:protein S100-G-like n=1 Tax=Anabas testudineus TaxID=64144 RepID=UPI000E462C96|nr:protein S100-G-like [Anabas testudineus]